MSDSGSDSGRALFIMTEPVPSAGLPLTRNGIEYAWRELARRAGLADLAAVRFTYGDTSFGPARRDVPEVRVIPCRPTAFETIVSEASSPPSWLEADAVMPAGMSLPVGDSIPVLFRGQGFEDGTRPFAERQQDGSVLFYADIVAATCFMLSRWEETVVSARDAKGRFPDSAAAALRLGFTDRPIVDEYALVLREWVRSLLSGWEPVTGRFEVRLSHDIDWLHRPRNFRQLTRSLAGDLLRRRNPGLAVRTFRSLSEAAVEAAAPWSARRYRAIGALAGLSRRHGLSSTFYFMAARPGRFDTGYDVGSRLCRRCIAGLRRDGHEIGLHGSYASFDNSDILAAEKRWLEEVVGGGLAGSRQHWLRFRVPHTWRLLEQAGLEHDSTMGWTEHEGFRCGTCHPFRPFDVEQDRELSIVEIPLVLKETTLMYYRGLLPDAAEALTFELARRCRQVEGVFTLLWHNMLLDREKREWVKTYGQILGGLARLAGRDGRGPA